MVGWVSIDEVRVESVTSGGHTSAVGSVRGHTHNVSRRTGNVCVPAVDPLGVTGATVASVASGFRGQAVSVTGDQKSVSDDSRGSTDVTVRSSFRLDSVSVPSPRLPSHPPPPRVPSHSSPSDPPFQSFTFS